jgi:hypothetical protein
VVVCDIVEAEFSKIAVKSEEEGTHVGMQQRTSQRTSKDFSMPRNQEIIDLHIHFKSMETYCKEGTVTMQALVSEMTNFQRHGPQKEGCLKQLLHNI